MTEIGFLKADLSLISFVFLAFASKELRGFEADRCGPGPRPGGEPSQGAGKEGGPRGPARISPVPGRGRLPRGVHDVCKTERGSGGDVLGTVTLTSSGLGASGPSFASGDLHPQVVGHARAARPEGPGHRASKASRRTRAWL